MKKRLLYSILLALTFPVSAAFGQPGESFAYSSLLSRVKAPGFYKIVLQPAIVSRCVELSRDIRILNGKGQQVPFILQTDPQEENNFTELPILSVNRQADRQTHIVISNALNKTISRLFLAIKNTDASRNVTISGSDDNMHWFVIKENVLLDSYYSQVNDQAVRSVDFPFSSYKYFEIIINGKDLLPVNIVKAGVSADARIHNKFLPVPVPVFKQSDSSNKVSYVKIRFDEAYLISKLDLKVAGAKYFRRRLTISNGIQKKGAWRKEYDLRSDAALSFRANVKAKQLALEIYNEDNPPLSVTGINAFQLNTFLLAYLEPADNYQLVFGDSAAAAPNYDLEYFKDSVKNTALEIAPGPVVKNNPAFNSNRQAPKANTFYLWIIICLVLAFLLILTLQMTKEVSKKKNDQREN